MIWTVFYHDGSTFSDEDGGPDEAPAVGVIAIVQYNRATGYQILADDDYFVWKETVESNYPDSGKWYNATADALWFYLSRPGWKRVLFGEYIDDEAYNTIRARAHEFRKMANHRLERKV